jgi:hypothetical protein
MFTSQLAAAIAGVAIGLGALASANLPNESVYFESGQYSASLLQGARTWRLQPIAGDDVDVVDVTCINRQHVPRGIWLVSRDADGRPQLIAPSSTRLPPGYPQQIALRQCGEVAQDNTLGVPPIVLAWLEANVNSVLVDE